jgi:RimJ/RimL family protein N-acetyltransferase
MVDTGNRPVKVTHAPCATRRATVADARSIAAVHVRAWQVVYDGLAPAKYLKSLSVDDRAWEWERWLSAGATILVSELDGAVVGFCGIGKARDSGLDLTVGEIYAMYVDPDFWRHAIGTQLCRQGLQLLRQDGFGDVVLWVLSENSIGRGFCERFGFAADGSKLLISVGGKRLAQLRYSIAA